MQFFCILGNNFWESQAYQIRKMFYIHRKPVLIEFYIGKHQNLNSAFGIPFGFNLKPELAVFEFNPDNGVRVCIPIKTIRDRLFPENFPVNSCMF